MILDSKEQDLADIVTTTKGDKLICKSYTEFTAKRVKAEPNKAAAKTTTEIKTKKTTAEIKTKKIVPFSLSAEVIYLLVYLLQLLIQPDNEQLYNCLKVAINYISDDKLQLSTHKIDDFLSLSEFKEINTPLNRREILIAYTKFIIYISNKIITDIIKFKRKVSITIKLFFNIITDLSNIKNCNIFEELYNILKEHIDSIPKIEKKKGIKKEINSDMDEHEDANEDEHEDANEDEHEDAGEDADANEHEDADADEDADEDKHEDADEDEHEDEDEQEDADENKDADADAGIKPIKGFMKKSIAAHDSSSSSDDDK
jgi:hypothetical protein